MSEEARRAGGPIGPALFGAALACLSLAGCLGGSDGIENPKLEFEFRGPDGTASGAGEVRLYSRHLDPVRDSTPLLARGFSGGASLSLQPEDLDAALRARLGRIDLPDTVIHFNAVAVSGSREAFVAGFRYRRAAGRAGFAQAPWADTASERAYGSVRKPVDLLDAVLDFKGGIGLAGQSFGIDYVYVPGSPYHGAVGAGRDFRIARLSRGTYTLFGADRDSAGVYASADTLNTADTAYVAKTWDVLPILDFP